MTLTRQQFLGLSGSATFAAALPWDGSLRGVAEKHGFIFGAAVRSGSLIADPRYRALVERECRVATPEGELKWNAIDRDRGYDFHRAEAIQAMLAPSNVRLRGHTLVWHNGLPRWAEIALSSAETGRRTMIHHIRTVMPAWRGRIDSWDVVNEALDPEQADGLRRSPAFRGIGPEYVELAFRIARETAPTAELVYNDYGLEGTDAGSQAKRRALLRLIEQLKRRDTPIDAVGLQAHLSLEQDFEQSAYAEFVRDLSALGVDVHVTELDVSDHSTETAAVRDRRIADRTERFLDAVLDTPRARAVVTWGLTDLYSWLNDWGHYYRHDLTPARALPFDDSYQAKPMAIAIARAMTNARARAMT